MQIKHCAYGSIASILIFHIVAIKIDALVTSLYEHIYPLFKVSGVKSIVLQ